MILKCTAEKEGAKEGIIYNRAVRCYCKGRLPNGSIFLNITFLFTMDVPSSTRRTVNTWAVTAFH